MNKKKKILLIFTYLIYTSIFGQWEQIGNTINGEVHHEFSGYSVSLSGDGSIIAVGGPGNSEPTLNIGDTYGIVRIYKINQGNWEKIGTIRGAESYERFGNKVCISNDGSIVAVNSSYNLDNSLIASGLVRVYKNTNNDWQQIGQDIVISSSPLVKSANISLNGNGDVLALANAEHNSVAIYKLENNTWTQVGNTINQLVNEFFGHQISLSEDGNTIAVSASLFEKSGSYFGRTRIYRNENNNWVQIGDGIDGEFRNDQSGFSLSINSDGSVVAIATSQNAIYGIENGHVRVYRNDNNNWIQIGSNIVGESGTELFGFSIDLSSDGTILAVGNRAYNRNNGIVRVYSFDNNEWVQIGEGLKGNAPEFFNDHFGHSVSLSSDGTVIGVGGPRSFYNSTALSGHAFVFSTNNNLSIPDTSFNSKISTFPNPFSNQFNINLEVQYKRIEATIFDTKGILIDKLIFNDQSSLKIDLTSFSVGIYFVKLVSDKNNNAIIKVIKI